MGHAIRVIVADDDRVLREMVAGWLIQLGHQVEILTDGRDLIEACRVMAPDLLVSDARMSHLDELADHPDPISTVLMSNLWETDQLRRAERLAAVRVDKPLQPLELVAAVNAVRVHSPTRVLVADSDADTADSLAILLGLFGCWVRVARDVSATEEQVEAFHPHLLLTDIDTQSELEMVRRIRAREWGAQVRIAAHTGWTGEQVREEARTAGCDDFLVKPVSPTVLRQLIDDVTSSLLPTPCAGG